ncbi:MAG TPA: TonB-dependent receptor, partial [Longimicrobiales bacterium]|nr:TonB-dependent receptor [Longimicrobiales bacterium]
MTRDRSPAPPHAWIAAALLGAVLAAAPATAQEPGDSLPVYALDSLIVSVLRTPIVVGEAAYPVSVVGEEALRRGKTGAFLEEALGGVPGVQIQNRYNWSLGERIAIRGFGARAQFGVRGIRLVVDEIPATFADGQSSLDHLDVGALGRVEVLRGPASALYGNAAGGVIRFETRPPPPVTLRQEAQIVGGGDGLLRLQSITAGRAQGFGYHLSVESLDYDGYRSNPVGDDGAFGGATRRIVDGQVDFRAGDSRMRISLSALDKDADNPGSLPDSLIAAGSRQAWGFNVIQDAGEEVQQGRLGVTWEGPLAGVRAEVSGYGILRSLTNPIPPTIIELDRLATGIRGQVRDRLALGGVGLEWTAGASLDHQRDDRLNFENDGGEVGPITLDQLEEVRALAGYLQLNADPHPRLDVQGGLRYDHFRFEADDDFVAGNDPDDSGSRTMDA